MEARLAFGQAGVALGRLGAGAVPFVIREKERAIRQSAVLEFHERARALGYGVEETRQGDRLRLVLVKRVY